MPGRGEHARDRRSDWNRLRSPEGVVEALEAIRPRALRPPKDCNRGQMSRVVLSLLRQAAEPMTTRDLAMEMLVARALDKDDHKLTRLMTKRVGVALRTQRENGTVRSLLGPGQFVLREVAR